MSPQPDEDERHRLSLQADYIIKILSERYGITPGQVVSAVQWVEDRKQNGERVKQTGLTSVIGIVITALLIAVWEGVKDVLRRSP